MSIHINYGYSKREPEPDESCLYCDKHEDVMAYTYFGAAVCGGCWDSRWREEGGDGEHDPPFGEIRHKVSGEWLTAPAPNTGSRPDA